MSVLDGLASIVADAMGATLFKSATLYTRGGDIYSCRALVTGYSDMQRMASGISAKHRKAIILGATLATIPKTGDRLVIDGECWSCGEFKRDPAAATYTAQSTRAPMPVGDTTVIDDVTLLTDAPSIINDAMGPALFKPALFYKIVGRSPDGRGGHIPTWSELECSALVVGYSDLQRGLDDIPSKDRKAIILAASLPGVVPKTGDVVFIENGAWVFVHVDRDPALATYTGQASPGRVPAVGRTGSFAVTLANATLSATGYGKTIGAVAVNLESAGIAATGTPIIVGSMAVTLGDAVGTSVGSFLNSGALVATLGDAALTGQGSPVVAGALAGALDAATMAGTASLTILGALGVTLGDATGSGTADAPVQGAVAVTLEAATAAGAGYQPNLGALAVTLDDATLSAASTPIGALEVTLADATATGAGYQRNAGALAVTLGAALAAGEGHQRIAGELAVTLEGASASAAGSPVVVGDAALTTGNAAAVGEGYQRNAGALAITLADATLAASAGLLISGELTITLGDATAISNGTIANPGAGANTLANATVVAEGYQRNAGALAVTLSDASIAAAGSPIDVGALASTLADAAAVGAGYQVNAGALAITADDATLSSVGVLSVPGALAVTLADATALASGNPILVGALASTLADATLVAEGTADAAANEGALSSTLGAVTLVAEGETVAPNVIKPVYVGGRAGQAAGSTSATPITVALNSGLTGGLGGAAEDGDLIIVAVAVGHQGRSPAPVVRAVDDTAYSVVGTAQNITTDTQDVYLDVRYRFHGGTSNDNSVEIGNSGNAADGISYAIEVWRYVDAATPLDGVTPTTANGINTGRPDPAAISATSDEARVIVATGSGAANNTTALTFSDQNNLIQGNGVDTNDARVTLGWIDWAGSSVNPAAAGGGSTNANNSWAAKTFVLRGAEYEAPVGSLSATLGDATLSAAGGSVGPPAFRAIEFLDADTTMSTTGTITIPKPTGTVAGDTMIAIIATLSTGSVTPPAGWTARGTTTGTGQKHHIFTKEAGGSEPSDYSFTEPGTFGFGAIATYENIDTTVPVEATSSNSGTGATLTGLSVTAADANSVLIYFCTSYNGPFTVPSGMTQRAEMGAGDFADQIVSSGATGDKVQSVTSTDWATTMIILNPA